MQKITLLPKWVFSGTTPSVYDTESGTCIEMTAKVYNAMRELQTSYNSFVDEINSTLTEFINTTNADQEEFKEHIDKIMHDYISMLDDKINMLETETINEVTEFINQSLNDGKIIISTNYDEDTKNLTIVGGVN